MEKLTILDGPIGSELVRAGYDAPSAEWTAWAARKSPQLLASIHARYAAAGATVHTANTFRTQPRHMPQDYVALTQESVALARASVPHSHRVAGSLAPIEDCYRPELSPAPANARALHAQMAEALARADVDILLCETFAHVDEALIAVEEAVRTGKETWVSFSAGPLGDLLSIDELERGVKEARARGASAVLVNCTPVTLTTSWLEALRESGARFGAYANVPATSPDDYAAIASTWRAAGASVLGACCMATSEHIEALARLTTESVKVADLTE